jgi:hypothetical protein
LKESENENNKSKLMSENTIFSALKHQSTKEQKFKVGVFLVLVTVLTYIIVPECLAEVAVYSSPGNLANIDHLKQSQDYTVTVNGQQSFVYETDNNCFETGKRYQDRIAFTSFDFRNETVTIEITCNFAVNSVLIRPKSDSVAFTLTGNKITFSLNASKYLKVHINDGKKPIYIFADESEAPETSARYYFGPGIHVIGTKYPVDANSTVYIAGGAVVEGTLLLKGPNIKIRGRGILTSGYLEWTDWNKGDHSIAMLLDDPSYSGNFNNHEYSGIIMLNSPGWFCNGYGKYKKLLNLKAIGWVRNSDFPHLNGDGLAKHCFVFNNDDQLITNTGNNNVYQDCVIDKGPYGRSIVSLNNNNQDTNLWEDIDIIADEQSNGKFGSIAIIESTGVYKRNYTYRNIRIEDGVSINQPLLYINANNLNVSNFTIENVYTETVHTKASSINTSNGGTVNNVVFRCIKVGSVYKTSLDDANIIWNGTGITGITFETGVNCNPTQVSEITLDQTSFVMFPNPASDNVQIGFNDQTLLNVSLFDISGKLIISQPDEKLHLAALSPGLYFVKVNSGKQSYTGKLLVHR